MANEYNDIDRILDSYFSGNASAEDISRLESWVAESDDNRRRFLSMRAVEETLHPEFGPEDVDEKASERLMRRIGGFGNRRLRVVSAAAAVLFGVCLVQTYFLMNRPAEAVKTADSEIVLTAPYGGRINTTLPDGSEIWLNSNSSLTYASDFNAERRTVELRGEAYFDVASDRERPFCVRTSNLCVNAVGTAFNVNAYSRYASVTLVEGAVDVDVYSTGHKQRMEPGEHLSSEGDTIDLLRGTDISKWYSWRDGVLIFDHEPMKDVYRRLEDIYNVRFRNFAPEFSETLCHATFKGEGLQEILRLFELSTPVTYEIKASDGLSEMRTIDIFPVQ